MDHQNLKVIPQNKFTERKVQTTENVKKYLII